MTTHTAAAGHALPVRVATPDAVSPEIFADMVNSALDALRRDAQDELTPADLRLRYGFTRAEVEAAGSRAIREARQTLARTCRQCGCTEFNACVDARGPCWWVEADLCSHCAAKGAT